MKTNYNKYYMFLYIALSILVFSFFVNGVSDGDTLFHIKLGEYILNNGIPTKDMFSSHPDLNYAAYAYGFDIIVYMIYKTFGFTGITIFRYLGPLIMYLLLIFIIKDLNKTNTWVKSIIISGLGIVGFIQFTKVRPQVCSFIILIIQLYIMNKWIQNKKSNIIWFLPLTFIVINFLHSGVFIFHIGMTAIFGINLWLTYDKKLHVHNFLKDSSFYKYLGAGLLSIATIIINPYFPKILSYSLNTINDESMMKITEWKPAVLIGMWMTIIMIIVVIRFLNVKKVPWGNFIMLTLMFFLTMQSYRYAPYLAISIIFIASYTSFPSLKLKEITNKWDRILICIAALIFALSTCIYNFSRNPEYTSFSMSEEMYPIKAVEYMKENGITDNLYNSYNTGAYLLFNDIKVFIDPRCDLYSKSFNNVDILDDFMNLEKDISFWDLMNKYNLKYALLNKDDLNVKLHILKETNKYNILYEDDNFIVLNLLEDGANIDR